MSCFFGYHLVKIGALSGDVDTSDCLIKNQVNISPAQQNGDVFADIDNLTLGREDSIGFSSEILSDFIE